MPSPGLGEPLGKPGIPLPHLGGYDAARGLVCGAGGGPGQREEPHTREGSQAAAQGAADQAGSASRGRVEGRVAFEPGSRPRARGWQLALWGLPPAYTPSLGLKALLTRPLHLGACPALPSWTLELEKVLAAEASWVVLQTIPFPPGHTARG